jgi:hypothetical protein
MIHNWAPERQWHLSQSENLHKLPVTGTRLSVSCPGIHIRYALRGKLKTINFHQFTCSRTSMMWYCISTDLICLFVCVRVRECKELLTQFGFQWPNHAYQLHEICSSDCAQAYQTIYKVTRKTYKYHQEPNQDSVQEGFIANNSRVSVPIFFYFPFTKTIFTLVYTFFRCVT